MHRRLFVAGGALLMGGWALQSPAQRAKTATVNALVPAGQISLTSAINKAGRQRMLSQRMVKAYAQLGLGVLPERSMKIMEGSRELFENQLAELLEFSPSPGIKNLYQEMKTLWHACREDLMTAPSPEVGPTLFKSSEDILKIAHRATLEMEKMSGTAAGRMVNVSGRQRMLSQRAAKLYMFREWRVPQAIESDLKSVREEFGQALAQLKSAPESTAEIKSLLSLAESQWLFFDRALDPKKTIGQEDEISRRNVATTSERLLEIFEAVTGMYEKSA
ncbi:MAG: type IV pili methyl-accepting chemotaxis transducer N-terminal domain-containing protein [Betaproteobacteria bacterium]